MRDRILKRARQDPKFRKKLIEKISGIVPSQEFQTIFQKENLRKDFDQAINGWVSSLTKYKKVMKAIEQISRRTRDKDIESLAKRGISTADTHLEKVRYISDDLFAMGIR